MIFALVLVNDKEGGSHMRVPVKWLEEYLDVDGINFDELQGKLSIKNSELIEVKTYFDKTNKIQVGKIMTIDSHPDAENLVVLQVDVNEEALVQIVTGATNCYVNAYAPIVRKNGRIADGTKIKKGRLRGVESFGMLCSLEELGFDENVVPKEFFDNIYILNSEEDQYSVGHDFGDQVTEIKDQVLVFQGTSEKSMSMVEVASAVSETLGGTLKKVPLPDLPLTFNESDEYIEAPIKYLRDKKTPDWMKIRLMKAGIQPSDFIEDLKKYTEKEFGIPIETYVQQPDELVIKVPKLQSGKENMSELVIKRFVSLIK